MATLSQQVRHAGTVSNYMFIKPEMTSVQIHILYQRQWNARGKNFCGVTGGDGNEAYAVDAMGVISAPVKLSNQ